MDELSPEMESLYCNLRAKVFEAMNFIGIPEYEKRTDGSNLPTFVLNKGDIFSQISTLSDWGDAIAFRACHMMRVGLYSVLLKDYFGVKDETWKHNMFTAYICHDTGKDLLEGFNDAFPINVHRSFSEKEMNIMKLHVESAQLGDLFNPEIKAIVARHHYYRKHNPYPEHPWGQETPEVKYLAQRLEIIDSEDAASTRVNTRTKLTVLDKILKRKFQSQDLIKQQLLNEYGELRLDYGGDFFARVKQTGAEFIEEMYSERIFGRENRLNPFEKEIFVRKV